MIQCPLHPRCIARGLNKREGERGGVEFKDSLPPLPKSSMSFSRAELGKKVGGGGGGGWLVGR